MQGQISYVIFFLLFSMSYAYANDIEKSKLEENILKSATNYFENSAKRQAKRQIILTVALIPPRDIARLERCDSPPKLTTFPQNDIGLLKINVSCLTGNKWETSYLARAMFRLEQDDPAIALSAGNLRKATKMASMPASAKASAPAWTEYLIKKGQLLELVARADLVEIHAAVIAEENGREGEIIRVKNKRTGKKLYVRILSSGEVSPL